MIRKWQVNKPFFIVIVDLLLALLDLDKHELLKTLSCFEFIVHLEVSGWVEWLRLDLEYSLPFFSRSSWLSTKGKIILLSLGHHANGFN